MAVTKKTARKVYQKQGDLATFPVQGSSSIKSQTVSGKTPREPVLIARKEPRRVPLSPSTGSDEGPEDSPYLWTTPDSSDIEHHERNLGLTSEETIYGKLKIKYLGQL